MVCCLYKRVEYATLKNHWFLKSNLKIKLTILHIKSITKRVLSVFIIFVKKLFIHQVWGPCCKICTKFFPAARARRSWSFVCFRQERIKLYPLLFSLILLHALSRKLPLTARKTVFSHLNPPSQDSEFFLSLCFKPGLPFWLMYTCPLFFGSAKGPVSNFCRWGVEAAVCMYATTGTNFLDVFVVQ